MEIGFLDSGAYGHATQHLSAPPILSACTSAGIKITAYGYLPSGESLDPESDEKRRAVERERFHNTAKFLNFFPGYDYDPWELMLNRHRDLRGFIITSRDGEGKENRVDLLKNENFNEKKILLVPPIATDIQRAKEIIENAKNNNIDICIWYPPLFARGVVDAKAILDNGEFGAVSYSMYFGTTSYPHFWTQAVPPYLFVLRHLMGDLSAFSLRATGSTIRPSISMLTEHANGIIGTVNIESNMFLQRFPHAHIRITGRRRLIVIDDAGLRRCNYFSTRGDAHVPHFTHDYSSNEPGIILITDWAASLNDDTIETPVPIADALQTMYLIDAIKGECDTLGGGVPIKADFRRNPDGSYRKLYARGTS